MVSNYLKEKHAINPDVIVEDNVVSFGCGVSMELVNGVMGQNAGLADKVRVNLTAGLAQDLIHETKGDAVGKCNQEQCSRKVATVQDKCPRDDFGLQVILPLEQSQDGRQGIEDVLHFQ